jgi:hypothetical protein
MTLLRRLILLASLVAVPAASFASDLEWTVTPYLFGARVSGDLTLDGREVEFDADFGDILEDLETGGMLRVGARGERWAYGLDVSHMSLGRSSRLGSAAIDFDQTVLEVNAAWRPTERFDFVFGLRHWDIDASIDFAAPMLTDVARDLSWTDPFLGVRFHSQLSKSWRFVGRFDVGGFNVGSELSWNLELGFGLRTHERFEIMFGYRVLSAEYESGAAPDENLLDATYAGPEIGFAFHF